MKIVHTPRFFFRCLGRPANKLLSALRFTKKKMGTCKVFFNINPSLLVSFLSKPIAFQSVRRIRCCALFIPRNSYLSIFPYQRRKACGTIWDAGWSAMQLFQLRCNEQQKSWKSTSTFSRGRDGKNKPRQDDDDDEEELSLDLSVYNI